MSEQDRFFKFLSPDGSTYYSGQPFSYNLPTHDQKWSAPTVHPDPAKPDGESCGPGRLHVMKRLDARYAPRSWWPWFARGIGDEIGSDNEKTAFAGIQLRRINRRVFWRCLCPPFNWGKGAYLTGADLRGADLRGADLTGADLTDAYLTGAGWSQWTTWPTGFEPPKEAS